MSARATVELTRSCSNRCVFCAAPDRSGEDDPTEALAQARQDSDEITFVGGEPSLSKHLGPAVEEAARLGFSAIGLQTNASELDAPVLQTLRQRGLTDLHLSIHGATPQAHDYHVGESGRFERCEALLEAADALGVTVVVSTVVTRSNVRVLGELPAWLRKRGVAAWICQWPRVAGRAAQRFDRVIPRLGLAMPYALHALERARRIGLPAAMRGAPLCALGSYAEHRLSSPVRSFPRPCETCEARPRCPGVDAPYVDRFTDGELHPRPAAAARPALDARHRRMFVGVGPLVFRDVSAHDAPAQARRRLPVLGRPSPATAEAGRRSDIRPSSKGLFPQLFESED